MDQMTLEEFLRNAVIVLGICAAVGVAGAVTLLVLAFQQIREIDVPEDADFFETLQLVPITIPLALDFLDMAFDVFSAPISWVLLEMLGLRALQMVTVFEGLIPLTQIIPTMTICWFMAKGIKRKEDTPFRSALRGYQSRTRGQYGSLGRGRSSLSAAGRYRGAELLPSGSLPSGGRASGSLPPDPLNTNFDDDPLDGDIIDGGADDFDGDYTEEEY